MTSLWTHRHLALNFLQREVVGRYVGSVTGLFWILLHPLALLGIYSAVFTVIFRVGLSDSSIGFTAFVALALWPWLAFSEGVQRGAMAIQANGALVRKVAFPNELLVFGAVSASYIVHGAGFMAALLVLAITGTDLIYGALPWVLVLLLVQWLLSMGLALMLAALQVLLKDVEHFLSPIMMIWFYATPVLYSASMIPPELRVYMQLNPLAYFVDRIRELLTHGGGAVPSDAIAVSGGLAVFFLGRWFFNRLAPHFEDYL